MQSLARSFVLLTLLLAIASCGPTRRGPAAGEPRTAVEVENRNFLDMRIYVQRGSQWVRLGTVTGLSTQVLPIPSGLVFGATPLRFRADPVGGRATPISHEITISPGDQVRLVIPNY
ncbi:MAG: hypothetical protein M3418_12780 [Gemmatimonadota bacterium]|nr:hypothetical protein [Gemmatimonadota bacterium]MDQ3607045.1 hypothetical protein [Gemmatimonadota bacterium]